MAALHARLAAQSEVPPVPQAPDTPDRQQIIDAIADETEAFYNRDYDRWAGHWIHHDGTHRLGTLAGGHVDHKQGWRVHGPIMARIMEEYPKPNDTTGVEVRRENMVIEIGGDMAWASFDQYTPRTDDPLVNVGLSYQYRVLQKQDGRWKFAFAGHGDTQLEYFEFPCIRVDGHGAIEWMNEAAKSGLGDHPVLLASGGKLRARGRDHDKTLQSTIAAVDGLSPIDIRRSPTADAGNRAANPLVLEDGLDDRFHVVWVTWLDGMVVVSFDDHEAVGQRLELAQAIYGLSLSQIKLAALVIDGMDLSHAAEALGITLNTARTHLRRMFDKTKVHSQTALVRLILSTSSPANWS